MKSPFSSIIAKRWAIVIALILVLTSVAAYSLVHIQIGNSLLEAFVGNRSDFERYVEHAQQFGGHGDDLIYLGFLEGPELFTLQKFNAIRKTSREISDIEFVASVSCLPDAPNYLLPTRQSIRMVAARTALRRKFESGRLPDTDEIKVKKYWPQDPGRQSRVQMAKLKEKMSSDPLLQRILISNDRNAHCIIIQLRDASSLSAPQQIWLRKELERISKRNGLGVGGRYEAGMVVWQSWLFQELIFGLTVLSPIGLVLTTGIAYLYFGRFIVSFLVAVVSMLANIWAVAATAALFGNVTALVAAVPLVILVVSTSDIIHFAAAYQKKREFGVSHTEALSSMMSEVGRACVVASVTTFIGFMSLASVPVPATRQFAVASAFGVIAALVLSMLVVPIAFNVAPPISKNREFLVARALRMLAKSFVHQCRHLATKHPRAVIAACCIIAMVLAWAISRCELYSDFPSRFGEDHQVRQSSRFFEEHFLGSNTIEVFFKQEDPLSPKGLEQHEQIVKSIEQVASVRRVFSLLDQIRAIDRVVGYKTSNGLPSSTTAAITSLRFLNDVGSAESAWFYDGENELRLLVNCDADDFITADRTATAIQTAVGDSVNVQVTGTFVLVGNAVQEIIRSQVTGFAICCVAIAIVFLIITRSFRSAGWALIPNLFPLLAMGGAVGFTLQKMDADILGLPVVALGLAVDDTVHFLHRYRLEMKKSGSCEQALQQTFEYSGSAIVMTTLILCCGLLPCLASNYLSVWMLGSFLVISLSSAVLADLLLLPALLHLRLFDAPGRDVQEQTAT